METNHQPLITGKNLELVHLIREGLMYLTYIVKDHNDALLPLHVTRSRLISLSKLKDKHKDTVM